MENIKKCGWAKYAKIRSNVFSEFDFKKDGKLMNIPKYKFVDVLNAIYCTQKAINELKNKKKIEILGLNSKEITFKLYLDKDDEYTFEEAMVIYKYFYDLLPHFYSLYKYGDRRDEYWEE